MPLIPGNGIELACRVDGDGPRTIVLINGIGDDADAWTMQLDDLLAAGYRVVRFDNRGIGGSSAPAGRYTSRLMAEDTKVVVDGLNLRDVDLVGVSMGGTIAQEYALAFPGDLRSLVLADTYARPSPYVHRALTAWGDTAQQAGMGALARAMIPWIFSPGFVDDHPDELAAIEASMAGTTQTAEGFVSQLGALVDHDAADRIAAIRTATLVMAAESDIVIPPDVSRGLFRELPNAEWAAVPGGHAAMWEAPGPFNGAILDFVGRH